MGRAALHSGPLLAKVTACRDMVVSLRLNTSMCGCPLRPRVRGDQTSAVSVTLGAQRPIRLSEMTERPAVYKENLIFLCVWETKAVKIFPLTLAVVCLTRL
jgi:hypothetical protein